MILAPASLLAQLQATAGPTLAYSAIHQTEIQRVMVASVIAGNDKYGLYHADSGQAASAGCALHLDTILSGNVTVIPILANEYGTGITVKAGGRIYVASSGTAAQTFSLYGVTRPGR